MLENHSYWNYLYSHILNSFRSWAAQSLSFELEIFVSTCTFWELFPDKALTPHMAKFLSWIREPSLQTEHWTGLFEAVSITAGSERVKVLHSLMLWVLVKPQLLIHAHHTAAFQICQDCRHGHGALRVCASSEAEFGGWGLISIRLTDIMQGKTRLVGTKTFLKQN